MYLFLVRHPDVVVNIWELFRISRLQFRQTGEKRFQVVEPAGTTASVEYLYRSHDTHVIYGEGVYEGTPLGRPVKGRGLLVLKSGYVRRDQRPLLHYQPHGLFPQRRTGRGGTLDKDRLAFRRQNGGQQLRADAGFCRQFVAARRS